MLKVIEFIKNNHNWRDVLAADPYNLTIKEAGGFIMLKYSQIASDFHNQLVKECRGLIIDENFAPVCVPFFKFGNYGESYADVIDWNTAVVEEKIDGSLIKLWNYAGQWIVSTNGTIFAREAAIGSEGEIEIATQFRNFADLFEIAKTAAGLDYERLNPGYTYLFELVSPYNRVVVPYEEIGIYHIGTRDNLTLAEMEIDLGIKKPRIYQCASLNDLVEMAAKLRYCEEGYVVKDKDYRRIKVKSPAYVAVHHLITGMNEKRLLELLRTNETDEFLSYFPEYKAAFAALKEKINRVVDYLNRVLKEKVEKEVFATRKDFAMVAMETSYPAFFFQYYDGKVQSPAEWLLGLTDDKILAQLAKNPDFILWEDKV